MANPTVQVELVATLGAFQQQLASAAKSMQDMAKQMGGSLATVSPAAKSAEGGVSSLAQRLRDWRAEETQQSRSARFFAGQIAELGIVSKETGGAFAQLLGGLAFGGGFGVAVEGVKLLVSGVRQSGEEAKKAAKEHVESIAKIEQAWRGVAEMANLATVGASSEFIQAQKQLVDLGFKRAQAAERLALIETETINATEGFRQSEKDAAAQEIANLDAQIAKVRELYDTEGRRAENQRAAFKAVKAEEDERGKQAEAARLRIIQDGRDAIEAARKKEEELKRLAERAAADEARRIAKHNEEGQKALDHRARMYEQAREKEAEAARRAAEQQLQIQLQMFGSMESSWASTMAQMMKGQLSFGQFVRQMWAGLVDAVVGAIASMLAKWAVAKLAEAIIGKTAAVSQALRNQAVAVTGAMAAMAAVPFVGPALAASAGEAMMGLTAPYVVQAGVAARGAELPSVGGPFPFMLHPNETVLPADLSVPLKDALRGGDFGGGPRVALHFHSTYLDRKGLDAFVDQAEGRLLKVMDRAARNRRG